MTSSKENSKNKAAAEDDDKHSSLQSFILYHLDKFFVDHIPVDSVKELRSTCKFNKSVCF
jgi:hypothetical protein